MNKSIEDHISPMDTQRFGFKIAKIDDFSGNPQFLCNGMKELGVKLIISRIKTSRGETINTLEDLGFRVKDIQLKYWYDLHQFNFNYSRLPADFIIREAVPNDLPQLVEIAAGAFRGYGHYAADTRLDKEKCLEIYKDWTRRSLLDKNVADKFFLAEKDDIILGFCAYKMMEEAGEKKVVCILVAVSTACRGQGVYPALSRRGSLWGVDLNLKWHEGTVLATNYPMNRSLAKRGFRIVDSMVTMHCWLDK